jgi:hypothetical protein
MAARLTSRLFPYSAFGLLATAAAANVYGCSSSNNSRPDGGTTGTTTGTTTGASGASGTAAGASGTAAGASGTAAGASGAGGATGSSGTSGDNGLGDAGPDACTLEPSGTGLTLYSGMLNTMGTCGSTIDYLMGTWFSYNDGTTGATMTETAEATACGSTACSYHVTGSGFTGYGAGVGFNLSSSGMAAIDVSTAGFTGLIVTLKGTTTGTRTTGYAMGDNFVHVKLPTTTNRDGDDYGGYCPVSGNWTQCMLPFFGPEGGPGGLTRDGFGRADAGAPDVATDVFDLANVEKVQFEFSSYTPPADDAGTPPSSTVSFDVWFADIAFY